jgi:hypothetical protein
MSATALLRRQVKSGAIRTHTLLLALSESIDELGRLQQRAALKSTDAEAAKVLSSTAHVLAKMATIAQLHALTHLADAPAVLPAPPSEVEAIIGGLM